MRRRRQTGTTLAIALVSLVALWCLYWYAAHAISTAALDRLLAATTTRPASIECPGMQSAGFPWRVNFACREFSFADIKNGVKGALANLAVSAPLYRPGHVSFAATGPLDIAAPDHDLDLSLQWTDARAEASAGLGGPTRIAADLAGLTIGDGATLAHADLKAATAESAEITARPSDDKSKAYRVELALRDVELTTSDERVLPKASVDAAVTVLDFGSSLGFDPRATVVAWLRQGGEAAIDRLTVTAGAFATEARGALRLSADGLLSGKLTVRFRNIDRFADVAEAFRPGARKDAEKIAKILEATTKKVDDENGPARQTVLNFREGVVSVGIIPIGFVPPLKF